MRQQAAEQVNLVSHQTTPRNISHLRLVLQLPINLLLIAPALVEVRHFASSRCLVGHNRLELMALLHRLKYVQLDRSLVLDSNGVADENKPAFLSPTLWFPAAFKVLAAASRSRHLPPQYVLFDPFLEHNKALERHRDRVFHTKFLQTLHHRVAEKGAVHAYLQSRRWKAFPDRFDTGGHKFHCAFGIMHVAATVQHIEYLTGLRHGAKQRIVTARSFLFLVKANRRAFGIAFGALHTAIEIRRHCVQCLLLEAL